MQMAQNVKLGGWLQVLEHECRVRTAARMFTNKIEVIFQRSAI